MRLKINNFLTPSLRRKNDKVNLTNILSKAFKIISTKQIYQ